MDKYQRKRIREWLNTKVKSDRLTTLTFALIMIIFGMLLASSLINLNRPSCDCSHVYKEISRLEAENKVCTGEFEEGLKSVFLDLFGIIIWAVAIGWVLHGVGFIIVRSG